MEFIDRTAELRELEDCWSFSSKRLFSVVVYGMRRVGKTELVREFSKGKDAVYFFVYDNKTSKALLGEFEEELKRRGIIEPRVRLESWEDFVDVLFEKCRNTAVIFDEFQNFRDIYPVIFSVFQRKFDENKEAPMLFVFMGSIVGLMKKTFENMKAPLYGRIKTKIKLSPLSYRDTKKMLNQLGCNSETDAIEFFSVFGGIPKYYVAIEDFGLEGKPLMDVIKYFFLRENAPFISEVLDVLRQEFGKKKGTYYTILEAIATGHTKLNEIATYAGRSMTSITRYLSDLIETYEIVHRDVPVTEDFRKTRKGTYSIRNPAMAFWFRYVHKNLTLLEGKNFGEIESIIRKDLKTYEGGRFEDVSMEFLSELNAAGALPFKSTKIGRWWSRDGEIDIVALNESAAEILFCECKWSDKKTDADVLGGLVEKSKLVDWRLNERHEHFAVISKSGFTQRAMEFAKANRIMLFDLGDFEERLR